MTIWKLEEDDRTVWYKGNDYHRLDGPAMEYHSGRKEWWVEGKRHRLDGPAIVFPDGRGCWFANGKRHRLDGPAYEGADGDKEWYVDGYTVDIVDLLGYEPSAPLSDDEQLILRLSI